MNILMLADVFFPDTIGGSGRVAYHLSLELSRKGHEVHIVTRNVDGKFPQHEQYSPSMFIHRFLSPQKESMDLFLSEIKYSFSIVKKLFKETADWYKNNPDWWRKSKKSAENYRFLRP
jgi:glycosyltransferase involved in cell wall biosynthesis